MIKYLLLTIALLVAALILTARSCTTIRSDRNRLSDNQAVLFSEARAYAVRDSLSALGQGVLRMELDELRHARAKDAQLIADMGVRLRRVNSVAKIATIGTYEIKAAITPAQKQSDRPMLNDSVFQSASDKAMNNALKNTEAQRFALQTPYIDINGIVENDSVSASIAVRDTIVQVLHRVPRFKFLGIWFGTRGVRQEIISKNPNTTITAAEYIEITK